MMCTPAAGRGYYDPAALALPRENAAQVPIPARGPQKGSRFPLIFILPPLFAILVAVAVDENATLTQPMV